jgi:ribosomal protein L37AE/L43A
MHVNKSAIRLVRQLQAVRHCIKCGHRIDAGDRFCKDCGALFSPDTLESRIEPDNQYKSTLKSLALVILIFIYVGMGMYVKFGTNREVAKVFYLGTVAILGVAYLLRRQHAKCPKCKTYLKFDYGDGKIIKCTKCNSSIVMRNKRLFIRGVSQN